MNTNLLIFFVSVIIDHPLFISRFIGNSLWLIALVYYIYISFLGYSGELNHSDDHTCTNM